MSEAHPEHSGGADVRATVYEWHRVAARRPPIGSIIITADSDFTLQPRVVMPPPTIDGVPRFSGGRDGSGGSWVSAVAGDRWLRVSGFLDEVWDGDQRGCLHRDSYWRAP